jgi:hypothetical protein
MTNAPSPKWRRTETIYPNTLIREDDWSLLDATGDRIATECISPIESRFDYGLRQWANRG